MEDVIKVKKLSKSYKGNLVVDQLNLTVKKGMAFGLLGANGAGKSTSIECILGIKKSDQGEVELLGMDPKRSRTKVFQKIGVQFQEANYQSEIRVNELCEETACLYAQAADWRALLKEFGIEDKERCAVRQLSGGERQRLFIVLALIPNPSVVFLDELTTGLDARARRTVWKMIEGLKKKGLTILLTSHFMDEVEALCDEICILKKGKTVYYGTVTDAVKGSPYDDFEDAYLWYSDESLEECFLGGAIK